MASGPVSEVLLPHRPCGRHRHLTLTTHQSERRCFLTKRHNFKEGRTSLSTIGALPS